MPGIPHQAPLELLRRNPPLAAALLRGLGVEVPVAATATMTSADETVNAPAELRADAVILLNSKTGALAVVVEVQLRYDKDKLYTWPAYVILARLAHRCPAVLLVICADATTARRCRAPIDVGHPGFQLPPLVIDSTCVPDPAATLEATVGPELTVLAVLTGALDLNLDSVRRQVLTSLAGLDEDRRKTYTVFILNAASRQAQRALEELMTTTEFHHPFVDGLLAEGEARGLAEGEASMILRVLAARDLEPPAQIRARVLACTDAAQLAAWGERAATANAIEDVFGD